MRSGITRLVVIALIVAAATAGIVTAFWLAGYVVVPYNIATMRIPGVLQRIALADGGFIPAELVVDHWGIPHIFAATQRDAFFLQGYNAARDRLWQIDLWRKRGLGLKQSIQGSAVIRP